MGTVMIRALGCALAVVTLAGCASVGTFEAVAVAPQESRYIEGAPTLVSRGGSSVVMLGPNGATVDPSQRLSFLVLIRNTGANAFNVGPESVSVVTDSGKPLTVFTAEQLEREARRQAAMVRFGAALQAASNSMSAASAGYSNSYGSYSGNVSAYGGGAPPAYGTYAGTYTAQTYDAGKAAAATAQANAANAQITANADAQARSIVSGAQVGALQRQTIEPTGQYVSPITVAKMPAGTNELIITIATGGDQHVFRWRYVGR